VKLENECGIKNSLPKRVEASADFIYSTISAFGGVDSFYSKFLISAVCPLGFLKGGLNYNYYDSKDLLNASKDFIVSYLHELIEWDIDKSVCFCLGNGKNYKYLDAFNNEFGFFKSVVPLPHPRWIIQYRRKRMLEFIEEYLLAFGD
jgi:hypothetical protein